MLHGLNLSSWISWSLSKAQRDWHLVISRLDYCNALICRFTDIITSTTPFGSKQGSTCHLRSQKDWSRDAVSAAADGGRRSNATRFSAHASASSDRRQYVFRGRGRMTTRKQLCRRSSVCHWGVDVVADQSCTTELPFCRYGTACHRRSRRHHLYNLLHSTRDVSVHRVPDIRLIWHFCLHTVYSGPSSVLNT